MDKGPAMYHGKTKHNLDKTKKVKTVTGQKPVSQEAKLEWRREYLKKQKLIRKVRFAVDSTRRGTVPEGIEAHTEGKKGLYPNVPEEAESLKN
jgi:hypothetical protein